MWDAKCKKVTLIDMGLVRLDPRAALIEALGTRRGQVDIVGRVVKAGDYQSQGLFRLLNPKNSTANQSAVWKRFSANRKKVEKLLAEEGLLDAFSQASIRKLPQGISGSMSKDRALQLIEILYEGI